MEDMKIKIRISDLMNDVQLAAMSDKNVFDNGYVDDVNRRIGEIESALIALKHELTKLGLNDW